MVAVIIILSISVILMVALLLKKVSNNHDNNDLENKEQLIKLNAELSHINTILHEEFAISRGESSRSAKENREEIGTSFRTLSETLSNTVANLSVSQKNQFDTFTKQLIEQRHETELKLKEIRETVEHKLSDIRDENSKKLDEMRHVVDEQLQETVNKHFNESFKLIGERLEQVHKGLGEMQSLAAGVGDLKKVLSNVKTRGNLGEIQLGAILEQVLSPEQYKRNVTTKEGSREVVEFAILLPNKNSNNENLLLPIDSKFPNEDYQRLMEAYDNVSSMSPKEIESISAQFEASIKKNAKTIKEKYINPPKTTDFAIMFVPTEGLYAEVLRRTGLFETLQRDYKITVIGPANLVAFLNSLQMGFRTLAIEKRSSEVWEILGAVKTEFGKFGSILEKTHQKIQDAAKIIDEAGVRSRAIERKLRAVQELPIDETESKLNNALENKMFVDVKDYDAE